MKDVNLNIERIIEADRNMAHMLSFIIDKALTVVEIAEAMGKHAATVRTWVANIQHHHLTATEIMNNGRKGYKYQWNGVEFVVRDYADFGKIPTSERVQPLLSPHARVVSVEARIKAYKDQGIEWTPKTKRTGKVYVSGATLSMNA